MKKVAWWLLIIGGINWGLVGLGAFFNGNNWNVVNLLLGSVPILEYLVYVLVGIAAVISLFGYKSCSACKDGKCAIHGSGMGTTGNGPTM